MIVPDRDQGVDTPAPPPGIQQPPRWPSDVLTLSHRRELEVGSAIAPDVIAEEGIRSVPSSRSLRPPRPDLRHPDPEKGSRFGAWSPRLGPGIDFVDQFKPDIPRSYRQDGKSRTIKYETPSGARPSIFIPQRVRPLLADVTVPLRVTEGVKKALSAVSEGLPTIALAGVDSWAMNVAGLSVPLPEWDDIALDGRLILLEYDSDAATKPEVLGAERRLTDFLEGRGARVLVVRIPPAEDGSKQGIDDYRARGYRLADLEQAAMVAELTRRPTSVAACDGHCPTAEALVDETRTLRTELALLTDGPLPVQESAFLTLLVKRAALARVDGRATASVYLEKDAPAANVSRSTASRTLTKLRAADPTTLPFTVKDSWKDGKRHVSIAIPERIGDEVWTPRAAFLALDRARFAEPRKKQGGSAAAIAARWSCPSHPDAAVIETVVRSWRCTIDECRHVWTDAPATTRHGGPDDDQAPSIQLESMVAEPVSVFGSTFATITIGDPSTQHASVTGGSQAPSIQVESMVAEPPALIPVSFTSVADQEAAAGPRAWGAIDTEAPPGCVWSGCQHPAANGFACIRHLAGADEAAAAMLEQ